MKTRFLVFAISIMMITSSCYTTRTAGNSGKVPPGQAKKKQEQSLLSLSHQVNERNKFIQSAVNNAKHLQPISLTLSEKVSGWVIAQLNTVKLHIPVLVYDYVHVLAFQTN